MGEGGRGGGGGGVGGRRWWWCRRARLGVAVELGRSVKGGRWCELLTHVKSKITFNLIGSMLVYSFCVLEYVFGVVFKLITVGGGRADPIKMRAGAGSGDGRS